MSTHNTVVLESLGVVMSEVTKVSAGEMTTACAQKCVHIYMACRMWLAIEEYVRDLMLTWHVAIMRISQEALQLSTICQLSLELRTLYLEKSPLVFILSIESLTGGVEGSGCKHMMPKLENEAFSVKSTQCIQLKHHKEPCSTALRLTNEVRSRYSGNRHTHTLTEQLPYTLCMRRGFMMYGTVTATTHTPQNCVVHVCMC